MRGIDLAIRPGDTYTILGGSGSGKSVCLKHMIGLLRPDSGRVSIFGRDVTELAERDWVEVRKECGMVFQGAALFDSLSVYENVAYPLREHWQSGEGEIRDRVRACLEAVGLAGIDAMMPAELSGGMRKRVGVARAIALEPRIVLYDEPTAGLDPVTSQKIYDLIRDEQRSQQTTCMVISSDVSGVLSIADRVGMLHEGELVFDGTADEARASEQPLVRQFVHGLTEGPL